MVKSLVTEIQDFLSLREIMEDLEERIAQYTLIKDEYSQQLGSYLRRERYGKEDRLRSLTLDNLQSGKEGRRKKEKADSSSCWMPYRSLTLSSTDQGEIELLFEAIEELGRKVDTLVKAKNAVEELMKVGFGENLKYRVYIRNGVPEKIVMKPRKEGTERFALNMIFSTTT